MNRTRGRLQVLPRVRVADELADVRKTLEQVDAALRQVTKAVVRIEGGVR